MFIRNRRKLAMAAGIVGALVGSVPFEASTLAEVKERGKLVMLCWPHQESVYVRRMVKEYGKEGLNIIGGIDVDLMRTFAERLGVELEVRPVKPDYSALIPSLLAGKGDIIASSMTITKGRGELVEFSRPYKMIEQVVVTHRDSPISSISDLPGTRAVVVRGTSHEEHLLALDDSSIQLASVPFMIDAYGLVASGKADFTLVNRDSAERFLGYLEFSQNLKITFTFQASEGLGIAVVPGSDLRESLDRFIDEMLQSGELAEILARHGR